MASSSDQELKVPTGYSGPPPIRVFLLMECRLSREALARTLRRLPDLLIVGASGQSEDMAQREIIESMCDVLIRDSFNEGVSEAVPPENRAHASYRTLLINMAEDTGQFLAAVRSGVTGYLLRDAATQEIVVVVRALIRGEAHCPPQLSLALFQHVAQHRCDVGTGDSWARPTITLRQEKLVHLVAQGLTNKEIAGQVGLSEFTVRNHVHRIMRRLKASNRREMVDAVRILEKPFLHSSLRR